ncbi:RAD55 family ATPase [Methermicoccus shengliensis]|uniref:KaiC domain-containing protein n=1 Tax=Methermicoccus shengliensis TaxID=660064 RepID=A0A832RYD1_9EURY|nr:MAG: Putative circadian clock protein, KaiC [Euryarchaeota archaeon 55_53]KUK29518.1 MAG: Putative circadian clock protein, KaiC [Methanosarcinales archeaon 56_1174]HIH69621.1 KaiC domain-containing protein [Methermicoccus shengliensis]
MIEFVSTGLPELDTMLGGGIPRGAVVTIIGMYGVGKTILSFHFLKAGLDRGEKVMLMSFKESPEDLLEEARLVGIDLSEATIVHIDALEVAESMMKVEDELSAYISSAGTSRVVIDSINILDSVFDEKERWRMMVSLKEALKMPGVTAYLTSACSESNECHTPSGILEYISDGIICLRTYRASSTESSVRLIEVMKMRKVSHWIKPRMFSITKNGISIILEGEFI